LKQAARIFDALAVWMREKTGVCLILVCWIFLVATGLRAAHSPFWYDELLTVRISALPRLADMWGALRAGLDLNPPFQYLAVRAVVAVLGAGPLAARLPVILGFLAMSLCLFLYLRRRLPVSLAFAGMVLPWMTEAYRFALNARPYGILLGAGSAAFLCWSRAAESSRRRGWTLAGLGISLALALSTHCYAVLLAVPLGLGELARLRQRRRADWPMWITLALSAFPVALYPSLLAGGRRPVSESSILHVSLWTVPGAYRDLLSPLFWPLILGAIVVLLLARRRAPVSSAAAECAPPLHELAALAGFAAIPAFAVLAGALTTGVFSLRYGAPGIVGIACLLAFAAARPSWNRARNGAVLASIFLGFFAAQFAGQLWWASRGYGVDLFGFVPASFAATPGVVQAAAPDPAPAHALAPVPGHPLLASVPANGLPLVISSGLAFLEIDYYASDALLARAYYVTDIDAAIRQTGAAWFETSYPKMKPLLHLRGNVEAADTFLARHRSFLVYSPGYVIEWRAPDEWLLPELRARGWRLSTLARYGRAQLVEASAP